MTSKTKNILSLDGGGVRGIITLAFLERLQAKLDAKGAGRLCDHFQMIGGTSTGSIIAAGLSLGISPSKLLEFYTHLGPRVFRKPRFRLIGMQSVFDARMLREELANIIGDKRLDSDEILTNLVIVAKRMDTGSPWIVHNNPNGVFWNDPPDGSFIGNRNYSLAEIVRASTAAPFFFQPELIEIAKSEAPGLFVDGGVSPHNMPAMAMLLLATVPNYGFGWETGAEALNFVAIGTGTFRQRLDPGKIRMTPAATLAISAVSSVINDCEASNLSIMQSLGRCQRAWHINSEIGDLAGFQLGKEPLFTFSRFNVSLEHDWLNQELGIRLSDKDLDLVRDFTNPDGMALAYEVGARAAEVQMGDDWMV